jgi:hypothetical protein
MLSFQIRHQEFLVVNTIYSTITVRTFFNTLSLAACFLSLQAACLFAENPNHKEGEFDAAIATRSDELSKELETKANEIYEKVYTDIKGFAEQYESRGAARLSEKALGQTNVTLTHLKRAANQLTILSETAGIDYMYRYQVLHRRLRLFIGEFSQANPDVVRRIDDKMNKENAIRAKARQNMEDLVAKKQWDRAEALMYSIQDRLNSEVCFLIPERINQIYLPFAPTFDATESEMNRQRRETATAMFTKQLEADPLDYNAALAKIKAAVDAIGSTGKCTWDAAEVSGPQAIGKVSDLWAQTEATALRVRAIQWALYTTNPQTSYAAQVTATQPDQALKPTPFELQYEAFSNSVISLLGDLISADASRASAAEAKTLFPEYLRALAPVQRRAQSDLEAKLATSLNALATKAGLQNAVAKYRDATDDLLRWKQRVAESRATAEATAYPSLTEAHVKTTTSESSFEGLYPRQNLVPRDARLLGSAPEIIQVVMAKMLNNSYSFSDCVRLSATSKIAIGRYDSRCYLIMPIVDATLLEPEIKALKSDLMVTDTTPALTLKAAAAIETALLSDMRAVGGSLGGLYLESYLTRFGKMSQAAVAIANLDSLPLEPIKGDAVPHCLMRYDVTPHWVQHDYFFLRLVQPDPPAKS